MKKSELKSIIRECIEEILMDEQELDEKTPNQKAHPRPPIGQYGKKKSQNTSVRTNTVYGDSESSITGNPGHNPELDVVKSGPRKGKMHKSSQKFTKQSIQNSRNLRQSDGHNDAYYPNRGSLKTKKTNKQGKLPK